MILASGDYVAVRLNAGNGSFGAEVRYTVEYPTFIAVGDVDGDGDRDVTTVGGDLSVLLNEGDGTLIDGDRYPVGVVPTSVALGDLDGDGTLDVATSNAAGDDVTVLLNACPEPCDTSVDCNLDSVPDCDEIALDPTLDADENGILDACEMMSGADLDGSGDIGFGDLTVILNKWGPCNSICECTTSQTTWQNESLGTFTGSFTMEFDHTPLLDSTDAAVMLGLSPLSGPTWDDYAILVRLDPNGYYNVRNADAYTFDAQVFYSAGVTNRIRIEADIPANTYSVWVTPDGGVETQIASSYAFRTTQQGITELDTLGVWSVDPDAFTVCDVEYGPTGALGSCPCLPDLDGNGSVGFADLTMLIAQWGACL